MLMFLKYLKVRYIDCHLDERAQGMVEYAVLIAPAPRCTAGSRFTTPLTGQVRL